MGSSIVIAAAAAALAVQSAPTSQALDPSGPWTVDVSEGICLVGRSYGTGTQQFTVGFRQLPNAEDFEIGLWINDPSQNGARGIAQLRLDQNAPIEASFIKGPVSIKGMHLIWIATKRPELTALPTAKQMDVKADSFQTRISLKNVEGALKALAKCERDLLLSWGMDPAVLDSIATPPRANIASFFSTNDYPTDAMMMNKQGTSSIRFRVGADGRVSDCALVGSSGNKMLDGRGCAILTKRGRFEPARTKEGVAVSSLSFARIRWEIARRW